jgi:hypothetical protein
MRNNLQGWQAPKKPSQTRLKVFVTMSSDN